MALQISPKYNVFSFPWPYNLDNKILIFEDRLNGWTFDIAEQMLKGKTDGKGQVLVHSIPDSEQAALVLIVGYFDMMGKCIKGINHSAGENFKNGFNEVFKKDDNVQKAFHEKGQTGKEEMEKLIDEMCAIFYKGRNSLFHSIQLDISLVFNPWESTILSHSEKALHKVIFNQKEKREDIVESYSQVHLNVEGLINLLKQHFTDYLTQIRNPRETVLREKFRVWFDLENAKFLNGPKPNRPIDISPKTPSTNIQKT